MKITEVVTRKSIASEMGPIEDGTDVYAGNKQLVSLEGSPRTADTFAVHGNRLTSLKGGPVIVLNSFEIDTNHLNSLKYGPSHVGATYNCNHNALTTLIGAPEEVQDFYCAYNVIKSLVGAPKRIRNDFRCKDNRLESLHDIHKHIHSVGGVINLTKNPIKSHVLGLLLIKDVKQIKLDNDILVEVLNKHLGKGMAGVLAAQEELIDRGLAEFAQL